MCQRLGVAGEDRPGPVTLLRLEGFGPSVEYRFANLARRLAEFGPAERIGDSASKALWQALRDVIPFAGSRNPVWRVSVPPASGAELMQRLCSMMPVEGFYDWSGGLLWLQMLDGEVHDVPLRAAIADHGGGHATLIRASAATRAAVPVFQPQPAPLAALSRRLKAQFDPKGILNPGRMVADA